MLRNHKAINGIHRLTGAAPGALVHFGSLADALPGSGRGRGSSKTGAPGGDGRSSTAPGSRRGDTSPKRGGGGKRPDTRANNREDKRKPQDGRSNSPMKARSGGQRKPYQQRREPRNAAGAAEVAAFKEAMKTESVLVQMPVPGKQGEYRDVDLMDLAPPNLMNTAMAPLLKYCVSNNTLREFMAGTLHPEEQLTVLRKLEAMLVNSPQEQQTSDLQDFKIEIEPNYHIERILHSPTPADAQMAPSQLVDAFKADFMRLFNLTEEQYVEYKRQVEEEMGEMPNIVPTNMKSTQTELEQIAEEAGLTPDSPFYDNIMEKLNVLKANPQWPQERKVVFARRLVKDFASL